MVFNLNYFPYDSGCSAQREANVLSQQRRDHPAGSAPQSEGTLINL